MDNLSIGKRLKTARQNGSMTLNELAEVNGISKSMLGQNQRGQSLPTVTTLWKIASGMKIPLFSFLHITLSAVSYLRNIIGISTVNGKMTIISVRSR